MSEPKTFSLKPAESQLLQVVLQQMNVLLSNTMSMIALERLAYPVSQNTKFEFSNDFTQVTISEIEPETEEAGIVTEAPKGKK